MKIAIVGAGFTGLTCAVKLLDRGKQVTIFEKENKPGGLAKSFIPKGWNWPLEEYYHHIFTNDLAVIDLAKKVSWPVKNYQPRTDCFINGKIEQLDTPLSVLKFKSLSFLSRIRMGVGLALLKAISNGQFLEKYSLDSTLPKLIGGEAYEKIWQKLLLAKFGVHLSEVNLAWFWARIAKRTQALGYFDMSFQKLADKISRYIKKNGGQIKLETEVKKIKPIQKSKFIILGKEYDRVVVTTPAPLVDKLIGKEISKQPKINYLSAQTLVLELKKSLISSYWLNILERDWPFLVVVEHTNLINKKHYQDKHVVYFGNYLEAGDKRLDLDAKKLLDLFLPFIQKVNPKFNRSWVERFWKFQAPFAQPVFPVNYSKKISKIETKIPGLYVVNLGTVYPWDRGTNYAVELGEKVAKIIN